MISILAGRSALRFSNAQPMPPAAPAQDHPFRVSCLETYSGYVRDWAEALRDPECPEGAVLGLIEEINYQLAQAARVRKMSAAELDWAEKCYTAAMNDGETA